MKKIILLLAIVFLLAFSINAQGLYRASYQFQGINYEGLLSWYGAGQPSFMRIKFYHPILKQTLLAQQNVSFISGPNGYALVGSNAFFLTQPLAPPGYTVSYDPDTLVFGPGPGGFFGCLGIIDTKGNVMPIVNFRPLMAYEVYSTLTEFGYSIPSQPTISTPSPSTPRATMHLIVVANTEDTDIGAGDAIDAEGVQREFSTAAKEAGIAFDPVVILGSSFSSGNVKNILDNLNPSSNDVVIFVYTGHGFRYNDDTDAYPRMALNRNRENVFNNNLSASEVFNSLKRKKSRLNITLIDSCNSDLGMNKPNSDAGVVLKPSDAGISRSAVTSLFLNARGNIIAAAASKGEKSGTTRTAGSFFIRSFLNAFMYETSLLNSGTPTWSNIINQAKDNAASQSRNQQNAISHIE